MIITTRVPNGSNRQKKRGILWTLYHDFTISNGINDKNGSYLMRIPEIMNDK